MTAISPSAKELLVFIECHSKCVRQWHRQQYVQPSSVEWYVTSSHNGTLPAVVNICMYAALYQHIRDAVFI